MASSTNTYEISVENLTFQHSSAPEPALKDINLFLPKGSRTVLIGANGAGKSTLLQILAGKRLISDANARVMGRDVFRDSPRGITHLGTEWAMNPVVRGDIGVEHFLDSVGGYRYKERRDELLEILDVDLDWRMHRISDGERRRVQLTMGLMAPYDVLLLDEITVDLDVQVRDDLLQFLRRDSEARQATIIYATHIFDGLTSFPTHVAHMRLGAFVKQPIAWPSTSVNGASLYEVALAWLRDDMRLRRELESSGGRKVRGPRHGGASAVPSDSETFYKKYDYSH